MLEYLTDHARRNVWCTPDQDLQVIFRLARLTPHGGAVGKAKVMWGSLALPTSKDRYHLYQIGQLHPRLFGLMEDCCTWTPFSVVCTQKNLIADFYTRSGLQFPRFETWLMVTEQRNLLIAVRENPVIADLNQEALFARFYSNAYFGSARRQPHDKIVVKGRRIETRNQQLQLQQDFHNHLKLPGHAYAFVNGELIYDITPTTCQVGDVAEFVYDSTIYRIVDLPVVELDTFNSLLDQKRKYLLHYPALANSQIDYHDDIDLWLLQPRATDRARYSGVYYHKNQADAVRTITHKDYTVPVDYIASFIEQHSRWREMEKTTVRLHVRRSGYERALIDEHQRIRELYKLQPKDVKRALLGLDSTVEEWRADQLENSSYARLMEQRGGIFNPRTVQDSYGYNAISRLVADSPVAVRTDRNYRYAPLPYLLRRDATVYEYDADGRLLGHYYHVAGDEYSTAHSNATLLEGYRGEGSRDGGTVYGGNDLALRQGWEYRFYRCPVINGTPTEEWEDVTDTDAYSIEGGVLRWNVDQGKFLTAVRGDNKHLAYRFLLDTSTGLIRFTIVAAELRNGAWVERPVRIPYRHLQLWLNGYLLIEGLDYHVQWPQVVICNKRYLVDGSAQEITVRASGHCDETLQREGVAEFGFVEHGLLSRNRRYDVRDDKIIQISVDGRLRARDALEFSEDDAGIRMGQVRNGAPYSILEPTVPLPELLGTSTTAFRERSRAVDRKISDYLTLKLPEPEFPEPSMIQDRYVIFSPFCAKVMVDLQRGIVGGSEIQGHYADKKVWEWLEDYLYLLDYDPTQMAIDTNYVVIHPHQYNYVTELNIFQYTFLERAVKVILNNKVDLSAHVRIGELTNG